MTLKKLLPFALLLFVMNGFAQNSVTEINTKNGVHYITNTIDYPITGTYLFNGGEPTVELNAIGTGFYQTHEDPKRAMIWGIECDETGAPIFIKGFDSAAYTLWYQYTADATADGNEQWNAVEFSIHSNTLKMYIQGERVKNYTDTNTAEK